MTERDVFEAVLELPPEDRVAYLDGACGGDAALRQRLEVLLSKHDRAGSFLEWPAPCPAATVDEPVSERPGTVIGPYKLLEQIGEGGFGVVFLAEQAQPLRRKVALKVLKPGMDTRQVVARFEAERQALAIMDHPNIAKVHDGGATAAGRPYFVMELVKGVPITDFCDANHLPPRRRLELFLSVCQAVQHAHQKGIIHRDLKPSNVLITVHDTTPVVKVIDFGVAKALGQELTDKTLFTGLAQMVGTPLYMSPEQAGQSGLDIDTRSDIYALGVLLYELLTGTTPFTTAQFKQAAYDEIRRIIRDEEPPKPSIRLSRSDTLPAIAAARETEPAKLTKLVRGELDWIVMKALEKDRGRRYETANGFAMDVQRYLADEPVQACPPSASYRFRKFARRNKAALAVAGLALLCIALVGGVGGWVMRDRAARQREADGRVLEALKAAEPQLREGHPWEPALTSAAQRVEAELEGGMLSLQMRQRAEQLRRDVRMLTELDDIRLRQTESKDGGMFDLAGTQRRYAAAFSAYGIDVTALEPSEAAARIGQSAIRESLVAGLDAWMVLPLVHPDHFRQAVEKSDGARLRAVADAAADSAWRRAFRAAALAKDAPQLKALAGQADALAQPPEVIAGLGSILVHAGLWAESEAILRQGQARYPGDFWINYELGWDLIFCPPPQHPDEAVGYFRAAVAARPTSAEARSILGLALMKKGDVDGAIAAYQQAIALDPKFGNPRSLLGSLLMSSGRQDEAMAVFREVIQLNISDRTSYVTVARHLGACGSELERKGRLDEAIAEYLAALAVWDKAPASQPNETAIDRLNRAAIHEALVVLLVATGRDREVLEHARAAESLWMKLAADDPKRLYERRQLAASRSWLANYLSLEGPVPAAVGACEQAVATWEELVSASPAEGVADYIRDGDQDSLTKSYSALISILCRQAEEVAKDDSRPGEARRAAIQAAIARAKQVHRKAIAQLAQLPSEGTKGFQAQCLQAWLMATAPPPVGDPPRAVEQAEKLARRSPRYGFSWYTLGVARYRAGDWAGSIEALKKGMEFEGNGQMLGHFAVFLAMAHWQRGEKERAFQYYRTAQVWTGLCIPWPLFTDEFPRFWAQAATLLGRPKPRPAPPARRPEDLLAMYALALEAAPGAAWAYQARGGAYAEAGAWDRAAADFSQWVKLRPEEPVPRYLQALALVAAGDLAGYRRTCAALVEHFGHTENPDVSHWVVWTCALVPDAVNDWGPLLRLAETAARGNPSNPTYANTYGIALYRAGRTDEAIKQLEAAHEAWVQAGTRPQIHSPAYTWIFLAMAHHRRGSTEEARRWLAKALESPEPKVKGAATWNRRLTLELFRREATSAATTAEKK
jgi:serine/threonine protein kinase/tetratricopeptide (TPR) repeat protein